MELVTPTFLVNITFSNKWRIRIKSSFALARARAEEWNLEQVNNESADWRLHCTNFELLDSKIAIPCIYYFKVQSRSFASLRSELSFPNFTSNDNIFFINQIVSFITTIFISALPILNTVLSVSASTKSISNCSDTILN